MRYEGWAGETRIPFVRQRSFLVAIRRIDRNVVGRSAAVRKGTRILRQKRNTMIQYNYKAIMLWLRPKRAQ